jgi:hypothetical protein
MKSWLKYVVTLSIGLGFALIVMVSKGIFNQEDTKQVYKILSDSFFVPGVCITGFGLLILASNGGTFDMLSFGMKKFFSLFKRDLQGTMNETFYDYRMAKEGTEKSFGYMIIIGLALIALSVVFVVLYY